jgi:hypothetical protein
VNLSTNLRGPGVAFLLLTVLGIHGCRTDGSAGDAPTVAFVAYDAGETLGLLPVAERVRGRGVHVWWIPLTPWSADLLSANEEDFLPLPDGIREMPHLRARDAETDISYWEEALRVDLPGLAVSGLVSAAQAQLGSWFRTAGIETRGFYDGFQPPKAGSIATQTASAFEELWVPTARVREGFVGLGIPAVLAGQPTLEAWRRTSGEVDVAEVRRGLGVDGEDSVLLLAGQYGPGYQETLTSFLGAIGPILLADSSLHLVVSHHPRTDGEVEIEALAQAGLPRATMAPEGVPTMEVATGAAVVLTWTSTVGVQAAFMGKPVVYYSPPPDFDAHLVQEGAAFQADAVTLFPILETILETDRSPESIRGILVDAGYVVDADSVVTELIMGALGG